MCFSCEKLEFERKLLTALQKDHAKGLERGDHVVGYYYEFYNWLEKRLKKG